MIYHITGKTAWLSQQDGLEYIDPSLEHEGFIHCSKADQVLGSAGRYFAGRSDLVILCIDESKLSARLVFENLLGGHDLFPHVYGPLDRVAIVAWSPLELQSDGSFSSPDLDSD